MDNDICNNTICNTATSPGQRQKTLKDYWPSAQNTAVQIHRTPTGTSQQPKTASQVTRVTAQTKPKGRRKRQQTGICPTSGGLQRKGRHWGSIIRKKRRNMARVISGNIGGIRPTVWNNSKLAKLKKTTRDLKADVTLYQELGVNWSMVKKHQTLYELLRSEVPTKISTAHNVHERNSIHQWGGTGIAAFDSVAAKAVDKGADTSDMGQWAWMKWDNGVQPLLMVTAYQPNKSDISHPSSVYQQQSRQLLCTRKEEVDENRELLVLHVHT